MLFNARVPDLSAVIIREQLIGEARAYQQCAEIAQTTYEELVLKAQEKQNE